MHAGAQEPWPPPTKGPSLEDRERIMKEELFGDSGKPPPGGISFSDLKALHVADTRVRKALVHLALELSVDQALTVASALAEAEDLTRTACVYEARENYYDLKDLQNVIDQINIRRNGRGRVKLILGEDHNAARLELLRELVGDKMQQTLKRLKNMEASFETSDGIRPAQD